MPTEVTVVIPVFNSPQYFMEALKSAQNQTVETAVIVVDDGSTDPAVEPLMQKAEQMGATVIRQENQGVSVARNNAIKHASTEYVITLDSDDALLPKAAEKGVRALKNNPAAAIACWDQYYRKGEDSSTDTLKPCKYSGPESMFKGTKIPSNSMIRRSTFLQAGGYPEGVRIAEDWIMQMRMISASQDVEVISEPLSIYRLSPTQTINTVKTKEVVFAQNFVLKENYKLFPTEMIVDELISTRSLLAEYRTNYHKVESLKTLIKRLLRR
ncbi:glycosyltransferase family 2 protein [Dermabacteraceae bacterium P13128]